MLWTGLLDVTRSLRAEGIFLVRSLNMASKSRHRRGYVELKLMDPGSRNCGIGGNAVLPAFTRNGLSEELWTLTDKIMFLYSYICYCWAVFCFTTKRKTRSSCLGFINWHLVFHTFSLTVLRFYSSLLADTHFKFLYSCGFICSPIFVSPLYLVSVFCFTVFDEHLDLRGLPGKYPDILNISRTSRVALA